MIKVKPIAFNAGQVRLKRFERGATSLNSACRCELDVLLGAFQTVRLPPNFHRPQNRNQRFAVFRQIILDARRHFVIDPARHDAVVRGAEKLGHNTYFDTANKCRFHEPKKRALPKGNARFCLRKARARGARPGAFASRLRRVAKNGRSVASRASPSEVRRRVSRKWGGPARDFEVAASDAPPLHLFLDADAYDMANQKIEQVQADLSAWKEMATATDVD